MAFRGDGLRLRDRDRTLRTLTVGLFGIVVLIAFVTISIRFFYSHVDPSSSKIINSLPNARPEFSTEKALAPKPVLAAAPTQGNVIQAIVATGAVEGTRPASLPIRLANKFADASEAWQNLVEAMPNSQATRVAPAWLPNLTPKSADSAATPVAAQGDAPVVQGVTGSEIVFGMVAPFSGAAKDLGRNMKIGIETAFAQVNEAGGVNGRKLRLVTADDGYEPTRTLDMMKQLYEQDKVFGFIGNVGTPTAQVAVPYALQHRALFFGAFTGASVLRHDPPDRYVFNYRPSYAEETAAALRYLMKVKHLRQDQIAVFTQDDAFGDSGYAGVEKEMRALRGDSATDTMRLRYKRNTVDVIAAVNTVRGRRDKLKAIIMIATYRAAARFIEKTREFVPGLIYTNVSFVGSTSLADELNLLGSSYATGIVVTQVVPAVDGFSSFIIDYKAALEKHAAGEKPDYVSLEGYVDGELLAAALKQTGPQLTTEKLVTTLESMRDIDVGLGTAISFSRTDHQASHKIWGSIIDANGHFDELDLN